MQKQRRSPKEAVRCFHPHLGHSVAHHQEIYQYSMIYVMSGLCGGFFGGGDTNIFKVQLMGIVAVAAFATAGEAAVYSIEFEATDLCYNCNNPDPDIYSPDQPVSGSFTIDYTFDANIYEESSGLTKTGDSLGYLSDAAYNYTITDVLVIGGIADTLSSVGFTYGDFFLRIDDFVNNPTFGYFSYREQCEFPARFCYWYASESGSVTVTRLDDDSDGPPPEVPNVPLPASFPLLLGSGLLLLGFKLRKG